MSNISKRIINKLDEKIPGAAKILANCRVEPIQQSSDTKLDILMRSYGDAVLDSFPNRHNDDIKETLVTLALIMIYLDIEEIAANNSNGKMVHNVDELYKSSVEFYYRKYPTQAENLANILLIADQNSTPWTIIGLALLVMFTSFCGALFSFAYSAYSCD